MTWTINPTITIDGTSYVGSTVGSVSINYGRTSVWETQRAGYAQLQLINLTNVNYGIDINDAVVVKVRNATNTADVTVFTGNITSVSNQVSFSAGGTNITYVNITAVAPLSILSKTQVGSVVYPVETEGSRISTIFAETSASVDVVDTGIYTLLSRAINPKDALALCNAYAGTATGAIYETTGGKVGYASENRRNQDALTNGYFSIPTSNINQRTLTSSSSQGDVINSAKIGYNNGSYVTVTSSGSTATYGTIAGYLDTEINNETDATLLANIYIGMRAYPQTSLSSVEVRLDDPDITNAVLDKMITTYFGLPVQIASLPLSIYNGTYFGFVEGWNLAFSQISARITLRTTEKTYSYRPTQWEDAIPTQTWNSVGATVQWLNYE